MPPGWTTRRRVRSWRPSTPISLPRLTAPITISVTFLGMVGALASALVPGAGHWPAIAGVAKLAIEATATAAVASLNLKLNIIVSLNPLNLGIAKAGLQDARDLFIP